jgi:hypothetical protein
LTASDLATHVADTFNANVTREIAVQAVAVDVVVVDSERADWSIQVAPFAETETPFDRADTCDETVTVVVVVEGPASGRTLGECLTFVKNQLRTALYETEFSGYRWHGNETLSIFDADAWDSKQRFLSTFRATYQSFQ